MEVIHYILSGALALYGFFFMRLLKEHDRTKAKSDKLETELKVLERTFELKHDSLGKQMERLTTSLDKLTEKIDKLTDLVHEQK